MRTIGVIVCLLSLTISGYTDVKWIPIEPINTNENPKQDINKSKPKPANKWIENVKIIQRLMDSKSKDDLNTENKKNWYSLEHTEND